MCVVSVAHTLHTHIFWKHFLNSFLCFSNIKKKKQKTKTRNSGFHSVPHYLFFPRNHITWGNPEAKGGTTYAAQGSHVTLREVQGLDIICCPSNAKTPEMLSVNTPHFQWLQLLGMVWSSPLCRWPRPQANNVEKAVYRSETAFRAGTAMATNGKTTVLEACATVMCLQHSVSSWKGLHHTLDIIWKVAEWKHSSLSSALCCCLY